MPVEPMTAAEYREWTRSDWGMTERGKRILAALEERERLLGEVGLLNARRNELARERGAACREADEWKSKADALKPDASLGALVRRIREHPEAYSPLIRVGMPGDKSRHFALTDLGITNALSHLDSLLPKEPEVVTGKSGREYRLTSGKAIEARHICADGTPTYWATVGGVPVIDAPVVAALMNQEASRGK